MTRVLSVASECAPLVKTGGLADVVGALPSALVSEGVDMKVLLPGYPAVMGALAREGAVMEEWDLFGGHANLIAATAGGLSLLVVEAPHLYERTGNIYLGPDGHDWPDNPERFAGLCWMAARVAAEGVNGWKPQVLHCHDWQAGLVPDYLRARPEARAGTVLTIHNIAFHGLAPYGRIGSLRLDGSRFNPEGFEFWGRISALKAGLVGADKLTTVSPTYAAELLRPEFGMGLDGVMRARREDLCGILNGIDEAVWNPATDPAVTPYADVAGKAANTAALRQEFGLPESRGPLCVVVSRLTEQKGLDLLIEALPALLSHGGQLAVLGSGEGWMEEAFRDAAQGGQVGVRIGYDEALSHRMMAGGDAILVPSRFEPCGLTQMYGLRYGTIPVVALTGGLADTVIHASPAALAAGVATGIQFHPVTAEALRGALVQLCDLFADREVWTRMQANAMAQPVGWQRSARAYARLYRDLAPHE
ncbi:glycogen synthase GlgA [Rubellimicrobium aerolatum]|uniref:Glycogen synthase n=1 Tax=Rubellimicrobium aerolatum TaxID=490979 RepID=A0ABW0SBR4_9RHOB|nr:glycogen synthase GlgA [Rubellimicrobium aerolatum]MBP1805586.1 starch synthase [Rubellimicrobium aerolatum]